MFGAVITLRRRDKALQTVSAMKRVFRYNCGRSVFFPNTQCLNCGFALGYGPLSGKVVALTPAAGEGLWRIASSAGRTSRVYRRCASVSTAAGCNWIVQHGAAADDAAGLCLACDVARLSVKTGQTSKTACS